MVYSLSAASSLKEAAKLEAAEKISLLIDDDCSEMTRKTLEEVMV